ncbi:uncharacterized protein MYCFIDRAFT_181052 [Pseudocercospora fijiensis CIRAD86]|uniref:Uncharacterized protein n=1 Tax=Pseudocercospora fijiensis (strain CIRAD86) TaxID=383855 RepID=N1QA78_PSEFD|nr:uncharacterized protein MYCFIDRAFT_181052 [Pseudocercospora fijiensis CIRAD86]EME87792.1 hypothetical protein MYCFIDRAFT_181052 [Pseudocercospora fijiensis CIRAD86]
MSEAHSSFSREDYYHASRPFSIAAEQVMGFEEVSLNNDTHPFAAGPSNAFPSPVEEEFEDEDEEDLIMEPEHQITRINSYDFVLNQAKELESEQEAADFIHQSVNGPLPLPARPESVHTTTAGPSYEMQVLDPVDRAERGGVSRHKAAGMAAYCTGACTWEELLDYYFLQA